MQLTPESHLLKGQIGRIFDDLRDLQRLVPTLRAGKKQLLRVVSTPTLANAIIPNRSPACVSSWTGPPSSCRPSIHGKC